MFVHATTKWARGKPGGVHVQSFDGATVPERPDDLAALTGYPPLAKMAPDQTMPTPHQFPRTPSVRVRNGNFSFH
jgi:hypothetical protein